MSKGVVAIGAGMMMAFAFAQPAGAEPDIRYGKWEHETTMSSPMFPQGMTTKNVECVTKESLEPKMPEGQECSRQEMRFEGNTLHWEMECKTEGGVMHGTGKMTYSGDHSEGKMVMKMEVDGQPFQMEYRMKGRRLGDCS